MTEDTTFDPETGELPFASISEAAAAANIPLMAPIPSVLLEALHKSVAELPEWITTDKENDGFKKNGKPTKYASLKAILETVRPVLLKNGIRIRQGVNRTYAMDDGGGTKGRLVAVFTDLIHGPTGQVERTEIEIPLTVMTPAAMGSAISYGRRYGLLAGLGLATDEADDDGEAAKLKELTEKSSDSSDLAALKSEMDKIKDASRLSEWGNETKQKKRLSALSEAEQERAKSYFNQRGQAILAGEETPAPAKKAKVTE